MKYFNVPSIDGIPGIMPGTVKVPPPVEVEVENDEEGSQRIPQCDTPKMGNTRKTGRIPKHRRMMPCDRKDE